MNKIFNICNFFVKNNPFQLGFVNELPQFKL